MKMDNKDMIDQAEMSKSILNSLGDQICVIDRAGMILFVNDEWIRESTNSSRLFDIQGVGVNYMHAVEANTYVHEGLLSVLSGREKYFTYEYSCHTPTEKRWNVMQATPLVINGTGSEGVVIRHVDVTKQKLLEMQLKHQAETDSLTGLYNRRYFETRLRQEIAMLQRSGACLSLLAIDVDNFKAVNDLYGHQIGDIVLKQLAMLIGESTRETDILARVGGDEFAVLLPGTNKAGLNKVASKILNVVQQQNNNERNPYPITLNISIGGSHFSHKDSMESILKKQTRPFMAQKTAGKTR
ncbi:sensor domain-containing diguanylate cyclase [Sinobaca sp. H24]|uniref:sensor domain-containing diguanylate cyclase n=1 Tax=Sinobaca sp. H24 TaxID=2923376 RepID=UPI00207A376C|nr:sensor domain-containing diguanylate cyclase [Sinobaca sp. H24]